MKIKDKWHKVLKFLQNKRDFSEEIITTIQLTKHKEAQKLMIFSTLSTKQIGKLYLLICVTSLFLSTSFV